MELTSEAMGALRQYLLGQLAPEQRTPLEERLLTDAAFHDELSIAEDDLIDRYLSGELAAADHQDFETHFLLAPERHKKLRFARALRRYVAAETDAPGSAVALASLPAGLREEPAATKEQTPGDLGTRPATPGKQNLFQLLFARGPALAFSLAAALLLAVVAVSWVAFDRPARREVAFRNPYAVTLTPGLTRGSGEPARIQLPAGADALRLRLELPAAEHESYRAALLTAERAEVWAADELRPAAGSAAIDMDIPASVVGPGDYHVTVSGRAAGGRLEDVSRYTFRVVR
ncbi:MAG TPA: hypothetical protein VF240_13060 [Pyrinomonadaceae bacterium]